MVLDENKTSMCASLPEQLIYFLIGLAIYAFQAIYAFHEKDSSAIAIGVPKLKLHNKIHTHTHTHKQTKSF